VEGSRDVEAPEIWIQRFKPFPTLRTDGDGTEGKSKGERRKKIEKRFARLDEERRKGL
jgi:hypothetical protein